MDDIIPFADDGEHRAHKLSWICVQLVVLSYISYLGQKRRVGLVNILSERSGLRRTRNFAPQLFALVASVMSWLFTASALVVQIMAFDNQLVCDNAVLICCTMYALAKIFLYCVMIEKVRLGNLTILESEKKDCFPYYYLGNTVITTPRREDRLYMFNWVLLCAYPLVLTDMLVTRQAVVEEDSRRCQIGLPYISSLPLLTTDVVYTVWLTWLFYRALTAQKNEKMEKVARKNFYAAIISMFFTELNLSSFVIAINGLLPVHLCLGMCTVDIAANVTVVDWLMSSDGKRENMSPGSTSSSRRASNSIPSLNNGVTCSVPHLRRKSDSMLHASTNKMVSINQELQSVIPTLEVKMAEL